MPPALRHILKSHIPFLGCLLLLVCVVFFRNYTPGTFLSGWDTLHPEFNFSVNFSRLLNGVWRDDQGLGAVAGHAHMSDLPRVIFLYILHFVFPLDALRWSYIFFCYLLGTIGIYVFLYYLFRQKHVAFAASVFYALNLGTVQQFFVPFEMFPTQWAYIPWIFLYTEKIFTSHKRKNWIILGLLFLLSSPQAYAPQLWYAFFGCYILYLIIKTILLKKSVRFVASIIGLTLAINAYWLLPNIYYVTHDSINPRLYRDNRLFSQEFRTRNRETGNLSDTAQLRGFYTNWSIYDGSYKRNVDLMPSWNQYFQRPEIKLLAYLIFYLSILGIVMTIYTRDKKVIPFVPLFLISFIMVGNTIPINKQIFDTLIKVPIFEEALRFVFSKFSILYIFSLTIFLSFLFDLLTKHFRHFSRYFLIVFCLAVIILNTPIFSRDGFISSRLQVQIPSSYFSLWTKLNSLPMGRVLTLPIYNHAGWQYYDWGYQGSGFIWFGAPQFFMDRDSDRWNINNYESYKEFFYALYNNDQAEFLRYLKKFNINYLVYDPHNVTTFGTNNDQLTQRFEIKSIIEKLSSSGFATPIFSQDGLVLLSLNTPKAATIISTSYDLGPSYQFNTHDPAYDTFGNYITSSTPTINYPFRTLLNNTEKVPEDFFTSIQTQTGLLDISNDSIITADLYAYKSSPNTLTLKLEYYASNSLLSKLKDIIEIPDNPRSPLRSILINGQFIQIPILTNKPYYLKLIEIYTQKPNAFNGQPVDIFKTTAPDTATYNFSTQKAPISITTDQFIYDNKTLKVSLPNLPQATGYILGIKSKYSQGIPLRLCVRNLFNFTCDVYDELSKNNSPLWDYFLIPPSAPNYGYDILLDQINYGPFSSITDVYEMSLLPINYNALTSYHTSSLPSPNQTMATNYKSFHPGWLAIYFQNGLPRLLTNHVLLNNWANAWILPVSLQQVTQDTTIYFFFWPQILEFIGFALIPLTILFLLRTRKTTPSHH